MSARSAGPDKCPRPPALGTNVRRPGQMSELKNAADKCPRGKSRRTNVRALGQMSEREIGRDKCPDPKRPPPNAGWFRQMLRCETVVGKCRSAEPQSANAGAGDRRRQMPKREPARGKCRSPKRPAARAAQPSDATSAPTVHGLLDPVVNPDFELRADLARIIHSHFQPRLVKEHKPSFSVLAPLLTAPTPFDCS
jgi:hypothetical protein